MIGRQLGNFAVLHQLGTGGVGEVYIGLDTMLNRAVAIKVLRKEISQDEASINRFRSEAENLARLNHPNITTLYGLYQEGGALFMIMELVRGVTLEDLLTTVRRLSEPEALALAIQAMEGLLYAHAANVIHRDIKPANLMVTADGLVKIMDFGIARVRGSERMTRHGHMVGTATYMAPEQVRGQPGDERSDIYSLGAVLYELLSGHPPFESDNEYELLRSHLERPVTPLNECAPGVSDRVATAVARALAKEPSKRFQSVQEFALSSGAETFKLRGVDMVTQRFFGLVRKRMPSFPDTASLKQKNVVLAQTRLASIPVRQQRDPKRLSAKAEGFKPSDHTASQQRSGPGLWPITAITAAGILLLIFVGFVFWDLTGLSLHPSAGDQLEPLTIKNGIPPGDKKSLSHDDGDVVVEHKPLGLDPAKNWQQSGASPVGPLEDEDKRATVNRESLPPTISTSSPRKPDQPPLLDANQPMAGTTERGSDSQDVTSTQSNSTRKRKPDKGSKPGWTWKHD